MRDFFTQYSHFKARIPARFLVFLIVLLEISACQTSPVRRFDSLKTGMTKAEVLEVMGGPKLSHRWRGLDRWTYWLYEDDEKRVREVIFENGKSIYVGPPIRPQNAPTDPENELDSLKNAPANTDSDAGFREI